MLMNKSIFVESLAMTHLSIAAFVLNDVKPEARGAEFISKNHQPLTINGQ